ncbi:hypothetical protein BJ878DRAFT_213958 [Calycina marina]|uniref:Uncharacterized protein n=1 Tax=Calycina marina TaxID=1763456 RepID=A0A9P7Z8A7_9HELO|nr:hypothetical protein BJ878DRAFT_213958 [Calycina marina]
MARYNNVKLSPVKEVNTVSPSAESIPASSSTLKPTTHTFGQVTSIIGSVDRFLTRSQLSNNALSPELEEQEFDHGDYVPLISGGEAEPMEEQADTSGPANILRNHAESSPRRNLRSSTPVLQFPVQLSRPTNPDERPRVRPRKTEPQSSHRPSPANYYVGLINGGEHNEDDDTHAAKRRKPNTTARRAKQPLVLPRSSIIRRSEPPRLSMNIPETSVSSQQAEKAPSVSSSIERLPDLTCVFEDCTRYNAPFERETAEPVIEESPQREIHNQQRADSEVIEDPGVQLEKVHPIDENSLGDRQMEDEGSEELGLFVDPSPVKTASPLKWNLGARNSQSQQPTRRIVNNSPALDLADRTESSPSESDESTLEVSYTGPLAAELKAMDGIITVAATVGSTKRGDEVFWNQEAKTLKKKVWSAPGKRLIRRLHRLDNAYLALQDLGEDDFDEAQGVIAATIMDVQNTVHDILRSRLGIEGGYFEAEPTRTMLIDVYFNLVPSLLQTIKHAIEIRNTQTFMTDAQIREIVALVTTLRELAIRATSQPKELQPEHTYQMIKPVMKVTLLMEEVRKIFTQEIGKRARVLKAAELVVKSREALAQREVEEKFTSAQLKIEQERRRNGRKKFVQEKSKDPVYAPYLAKNAASRRSFSIDRPQNVSGRDDVVTGLDKNNHNFDGHVAVEDEDDEPFANTQPKADDFQTKLYAEVEGYEVEQPSGHQPQNENMVDEAYSNHDVDIERVQVFDRNNVHETPRVFSREEKDIFIDIMQQIEKGHDRYQLAADRLDVPLPDIHDLAEDLQDLADRKHQEGKWNSAEEAWTYQVWAPKNEA